MIPKVLIPTWEAFDGLSFFPNLVDQCLDGSWTMEGVTPLWFHPSIYVTYFKLWLKDQGLSLHYSIFNEIQIDQTKRKRIKEMNVESSLLPISFSEYA